MKRFEWRLQRVLDIKDKAERLKRAELLQLGERLVEAHAILRAQQRLLRETLAQVARLEDATRISEQALVLKQSAHNDQHMQRLQATIGRLEAEKEAKAAEVLALRREREGLERLRAQALEVFVAEQEKREQREVDNQVSIRFARQRQSKVTSSPDQRESETENPAGSFMQPLLREHKKGELL